MASKYEEFKGLFPSDTKIIIFNGTNERFEAVVRCHYKTKEDFVEKWLKQFETLNNVGLRTCVTRPTTGKTVLFKAVYRCQHNTYPNSHQNRTKKAHKKHTDCPAILRVTIKSDPGNRRLRSKDSLRTEFPTIVVIVHNHNHELNKAFPIQMHKKLSRQCSVIHAGTNCDSVSLLKETVLLHGVETSENTTDSSKVSSLNKVKLLNKLGNAVLKSEGLLLDRKVNIIGVEEKYSNKHNFVYEIGFINECASEELVESEENYVNRMLQNNSNTKSNPEVKEQEGSYLENFELKCDDTGNLNLLNNSNDFSSIVVINTAKRIVPYKIIQFKNS